MSKWQHFLHIFGVHDFHAIERWDEKFLLVGHGPHVPQMHGTVTMVKKKCCHCGVESIRTEREWVFGR